MRYGFHGVLVCLVGQPLLAVRFFVNGATEDSQEWLSY